MKEVYVNYLFDKNILVGTEGVKTGKESFDVFASLARIFGIEVISGLEYLTPSMIHLAEEHLGVNVPEPFYKGFPQSVLKLTPEEILIDQILHYYKTYCSGNFYHEQGEARSIFEEEIVRPLFKEKTEINVFDCLNEEEAMEKIFSIVSDLLASSRPLSPTQYELVLEAIEDLKNYPKKKAEVFSTRSKDTAVKLLVDTRDIYTFGPALDLPDVLKVVEQINYKEYGKKKLNKLNFKNQDRKFVETLLDFMFTERYDSPSELQRQVIFCFEKQAKWAGLLHHIHYRADVNKLANEFASMIRGKVNFSLSSFFEHLLETKGAPEAADFLVKQKGSGELLRHLDYILSRCKSEKEVEKVVKMIGTSCNGLVLMQLLYKYMLPQKALRTFKWQKFGMMKSHKETPEEGLSRKTDLSEGVKAVVKNRIVKLFDEKYKGTILGKVYVDPDMANIALPISEGTSFGGYGMLPKGSRMNIPDGKKVRVFTYWEKVDDIDLSALALDKKGRVNASFYWRTLHDFVSKAIVHSGDVTDGYDGGSEYFDIDLDNFVNLYPWAHYLVFIDNVYSSGHFSDCTCRAGFMLRDKLESGEIFEPKTVETSYTINCDSKCAYLFAIDLRAKQMVWLNMAKDSASRICTQEEVGHLDFFFKTVDVMNVWSFFTIAAKELTDDISEADIIVSDKKITWAKEGAQIIRSCDFEPIMRYMNV